MTQERKPLKAWGDDVALRGPDAPRNDGSIKHLIEYLLSVYDRFGNTTVTADLQWGATALHKLNEEKERIAELEAEIERLKAIPTEALRTPVAWMDERNHCNLVDAETMDRWVKNGWHEEYTKRLTIPLYAIPSPRAST